MKKGDIFVLIGLIFIVSSISASVLFGFHFWYAFFTTGSFMFFGALNYKRKSDSVFSYILKGKWESFFLVFIVLAIMGILVDTIYGRIIANLWHYPFLKGFWSYAYPVVFYYAFGCLGVYETYNFLKPFLSKRIHLKHHHWFSDKVKHIIAIILVVVLVLAFIIPVINLLFNSNYLANEILTIIMIVIIFSIDAIVYLISGKSLLFDIIEGGRSMNFINFMIIWLIIVVSNEIPNTFSWEWVYHNIGFVNYEIFKVNSLIFTFGWLFCMVIPIKLVELTKILFKLE